MLAIMPSDKVLSLMREENDGNTFVDLVWWVAGGKKRIETGFVIGWYSLIRLIFWSVKFEQCEVKVDKIRVMHETWIQTIREDARDDESKFYEWIKS